MTDTDPIENDEDWLRRHGALIREATESHLDDPWIARAREETGWKAPRIGATPRDGYYWRRWALTVLGQVFAWLGGHFGAWFIQWLRDTGRGVIVMMRHPVLVVLTIIVWLLVIGFIAGRL
jgi:hypothetical protein